jgi:Ca2+-binding RTX toxin-like protein
MTPQQFRLLSVYLLLLTSNVAFGVSKIVDGGAGTDLLTINYSGISSLGDFAITTSGDYLVLTDSSSNNVSFKNIDNLTVGSYTYTENTSAKFYWNSTEAVMYMYEGSSVSSADIMGDMSGSGALVGFATGLSVDAYSGTLTAQGSPLADGMNLNINRASSGGIGRWLSGGLVLNLGAGNDSLNSTKFRNGDSVDMGAGDDVVYVMIGGSNGTPTISDANFSKLDGGSGSDLLAFAESSGTDDQALTLVIGGATNFENLLGASASETLQGDGADNKIAGDDGQDAIYGFAGNDELTAGGWSIFNRSSDSEILGNYVNDTNNNDNDNLYGGSGNDTLFGSIGDNTLDGGTGSDTIYSGNGSDTIIIRPGDGSTTLSDADVIMDFTNGSDVLGMSSVNFDDLTVAQGSGSYSSDTLLSYTSSGEYLAVLKSISLSKVTALDFASTSTSNQVLTGTSGDNTLIGGAGNDTLTTGAGSDILLGSAGDDAITVNGLGNKVVDGGSGTDSLTISLSGVIALSNYTMSMSSDYKVFTDSDGNTIQFKNIESLTIGSYTYSENTSAKFYWNSTEAVMYMYEGSSVSSADIMGDMSGSGALVGFATGLSVDAYSGTLTAQGSPLADGMNLNINRASSGGIGRWLSGGLVLNLGAGNDSLNSTKFRNGDSVDMGAGDDVVYVMIGGSNGTPTISDANFSKLDGGSGSDLLAFAESSGTDDQALTLVIGGATNFENLLGASASETLQGDGADNKIAGDDGQDAIYGFAGNDELTAGGWSIFNRSSDSEILGNYVNDTNNNDNDNLYGGSGNDTLFGSIGDNTLDGGTGSDTIYSGNGLDTIVTRTGDGGSSLSDADIIADFTDESDIVGLSGLNYSDLTVQQGTGSYSSHVVVQETSTGDFLLIIQNQSIGNIDDNDFSAI